MSETLPKPITWLGMEKLNLTQQKHIFSHQSKEMYYNTKYTKKTKDKV